MAKATPDIVIDRLGTHLFRVTRKDGTNWLSWDWDVLLKEVQAATIGEATPAKKTAKKNLDKETETKVAKTRVKKTPATKKPAK